MFAKYLSRRSYSSSSIREINLGKLDFALSNNFSHMFGYCENLEILDVSHLNTENSKSFAGMFSGCEKLKEINVSQFKTQNCENIERMFANCFSIESIDMLNWDMKNIKDINYLFYYCSKLKSIKMNFNNNKADFDKKSDIFKGLPENGSFTWRKGVDCKRILEILPVSWNRSQE